MSGAVTIPVVRLEGMIAARGRGQGLSLQRIEPVLEKAFNIRRAPCVALSINSPGGSPVQSALIAKRVRELAEDKRKRVIVAVEDVAASGGYWLACAGDEIVADPSSILGSIGVIGGGFGFPELLGRLGVERRVYTAGRVKSKLDPFRPEDPQDVARLQRLLDDVHQDFIAYVRDRRGARLKANEPSLFEGEVFTGREALALGLIDELGDLRSALRARYGDAVKLKRLSPARGIGLRRFFAAAVEEAFVAAEERVAFAAYGR